MVWLGARKAVNETFRQCGPGGAGAIKMLRAWAFGGAAPAWPEFKDRAATITHRCRTAIEAGVRGLGLCKGDVVLAPAYHCGTEIDALLAAGCEVVLYRTGARGEIDVEDAAERGGERVRAMYVIHYFGWPQDLAKARDLCASRGWSLIEDCALSLFSEHENGSPTGLTGDVSVFSLTKTLAVADGGALSLREGLGRADGGGAWKSAPSERVGKEAARMVRRAWGRWSLEHVGARWTPSVLVRTKSGGRGRHAASDAEVMPSAYFFDAGKDGGRAASRVTLGLLRGVDREDVRAARRRNYGALGRALGELGTMRPLFDELPARVCPLVFPLVAKDRDGVLGRLEGSGVSAIAWWSGGHPRMDLAAFPEARALKRSVVALPVHQGLDERDMAYIAARVREADAACTRSRS